MLLASSGFVVLARKKELELGGDALLHRADHDAELKRESEFECAKAASNEYAFRPGGAVRAINPNSSMTLAETDTCLCCFKGNLTNKGELAMGLVGCPSAISEAALLIQLYAKLGLDMLPRLAGQYAFCLYDSKQARVLAARDHSGNVPLMEGRSAEGSLIIACGTFLPDGVTQAADIQPGTFKYGWHAPPRPFQCGPNSRVIAGRASCDYGIRRRSVDAYAAAPVRASIDQPQPRHCGSAYGTAGRYQPPHHASNGSSGAGSWSRQRAASLDSGGWGTQAGVAGSGRRRSETQHPPAGAPGGSHARPAGPQHHQSHAPHTPHAPQRPGVSLSPNAAATAAAAASAALACSPAAKKLQAPQQLVPPPSPQLARADSAVSQDSTPSSGGDLASPHTRHRRRRHRRRHGGAGGDKAAGDGASSDAESTGTHDSGSAANPAAAAAASPQADKVAPGGRKPGAAAGSSASPAGKPHARSPQQGKAQPAAAGSPGARPDQQRRSSSGSGSGAVKRVPSCNELAAAAPAAAAHAAVLVAAEGLAH